MSGSKRITPLPAKGRGAFVSGERARLARWFESLAVASPRISHPLGGGNHIVYAASRSLQRRLAETNFLGSFALL